MNKSIPRRTHVVKKDELVSPAAIEIADSVENAVPDEGGEKLLNEESQQTTADDGQVQVVDLERTVQAECRAAPHELAATQNDDVVCNERNGRLFVGGHERLARREAEILSGIAKHLLPCGGEDGPEGDAEGTVESRNTDLEVLEGRHDCGCWWSAWERRRFQCFADVNPAGSGGSNRRGGRVQPAQPVAQPLANARRVAGVEMQLSAKEWHERKDGYNNCEKGVRGHVGDFDEYYSDSLSL